MRLWTQAQTLTLWCIFYITEGRMEINHYVSHRISFKSKLDRIHSLLTTDGNRREMSFNQTRTIPRQAKKFKKSIARRATLAKSRKYNYKGTKKLQYVLQAKRKSDVNVQENQAKSPVMYTSSDGKDSYMIIRGNQHSQQSQALQQDTPPIPNLPSKTFLVTVYGDQVEGAEEKLRHALTERQSCPCKCSRVPCEQTEEVCPCDEKQEGQATQVDQGEGLQSGGQKIILFPNAGRPFGRFGCICPCCLCSCSEPRYENYKCGCQNLSPVPCPCSDANSGIQPQISMPADSNCECGITSQTPCSCNANSLQIPLGTSSISTTENQVASWTGGAQSCHCPCCQCACAQPEMYPNYQCGCMNHAPTPCPCNNQEWGTHSSQFGIEDNVVMSAGNNPSTWNNPYPSLIENNTPQSPGNSPDTSSTGNNMVQSPVNNPLPENSPIPATAGSDAQSLGTTGNNPYPSTSQNSVVQSPGNGPYS